MITASDIHSLAVFMVESHGRKALGLADRAVEEMVALNEQESADCWVALRSVVADMLAGRMSDQPIRLH
jgi:hypothetical protein